MQKSTTSPRTETAVPRAAPAAEAEVQEDIEEGRKLGNYGLPVFIIRFLGAARQVHALRLCTPASVRTIHPQARRTKHHRA